MIKDGDGVIMDVPRPCSKGWLKEEHRKYYIQDEFGLYRNKNYKIPNECINEYNKYKWHRTYMLLRNLYHNRYKIWLFYKTAKLIKYEEDNIFGNTKQNVQFCDIIMLIKKMKHFKRDYNEV